MQRWRLLLAAVAAILVPCVCQAKTPLVSTESGSRTLPLLDRLRRSDDGAEGASVSAKSKRKGPGPSLRMPKMRGRSGDEKAEPPGSDDDRKENEEEGALKSNDKARSDSEGGVKKDGVNGASHSEETEAGTEDEAGDVEASPSPPDLSNEKTAKPPEQEEAAQLQSSKDDKQEAEPQQSKAQPANRTRSSILYLPAGPVVPQPRGPVPFPYAPQQQPPKRDRASSLLSSLLAALLPRPQNVPPPPYGPPMPPSPTSPPVSPIVAMVLRLALLSAVTTILDFLGLGSRADAFLPPPEQHYTFERVNDRYRRDRSALRQALESPPPGVLKRRWKRVFWRRKREAATALASTEASEGNPQEVSEPPSLSGGGLYNRTVIILEMKPDSRVGNGIAEQLRDTVTFLIEQHRDHADRRNEDVQSKLIPSYLSRSSSPNQGRRTHNGIRPALGREVEVVIFLDSPGGTVQDYGLASSHLSRLRDEPHITLSVCVDRVAASGGYMMACQATPGHLFAAPFAMVGSIGVLMETVNVNEVLKRYGVKPLVIKAGKNKAPLKTLGEVTQEELKMAQDDADGIHEAFQRWVTRSRPGVVASKDWIEKVCTGSVFIGQEARELGLVDRVITSDEYVAERIAAGDRVLKLVPYRQEFGLKVPLDLVFMDAEGRARLRKRIRGFGMGAIRRAAPLFRAGVMVGVLNRLASLPSRPDYRWEA